MKPLAEFTPFLALAVAAHLGGFALLAERAGGASAGGEDGSAAVSLEGADSALTALVAEWVRAPAVMSEEPTAPPDNRQSPAGDEPAALPVPQTFEPVLSALSPVATDRPSAAMPESGAALPASPPPPPEAAALAAALMAAPERSPQPPPRPDRSAAPAARAQPQTPVQETATRAASLPPAPAPASASPPAQRAAGAGASALQAQPGQGAASSREEGDTGGLMAQWGGAIRAAVQRQQRLPGGARRSGTVHLRLEVHSNGRLLGVQLHQSSGQAALDRAAIEAVQRARIPAAPAGLSGAYQFNLPVHFSG